MIIWKVWNFKLKNYDSLDMIGWLGQSYDYDYD